MPSYVPSYVLSNVLSYVCVHMCSHTCALIRVLSCVLSYVCSTAAMNSCWTKPNVCELLCELSLGNHRHWAVIETSAVTNIRLLQFGIELISGFFVMVVAGTLIWSGAHRVQDCLVCRSKVNWTARLAEVSAKNWSDLGVLHACQAFFQSVQGFHSFNFFWTP